MMIFRASLFNRHRVARILMLCTLLGFLSPFPAIAEEDIDASIERARAALDRAASRLAELQARSFKSSSEAKRAMLGVLIGYGPPTGGLKLDGVTSGGGAQAAGIQAGDVILSVGGQALGKGDVAMKTLVKFMHDVTPGTVVALEYERDGKTQIVDVETKAHGELMHQFVPTELLDGLRDLERIGDNVWFWQGDAEGTANIEVFSARGLYEADKQMRAARLIKLPDFEMMYVQGDLAQYFDVEEGVVVLRAPPHCEIKDGDVLLNLDGERVKHPSSAIQLLATKADRKPAERHQSIIAEVLRQGQRKKLKIDPTRYISFADVDSGERATATVLHMLKEAQAPEPPKAPNASDAPAVPSNPSP